MHKTHEVILGKPFSNKGKTQQPFAILPREETLSIENMGANKGGSQDKTLTHTIGCSMTKKDSAGEMRTKLQLSK
jgi:hypothetical protein